ncbi:uncharacterized protein V6R79_012706 [Siganus canaliculatus]
MVLNTVISRILVYRLLLVQRFLNGLGLDSDIAGLSIKINQINRLCLELSDLQPHTVSNAVGPFSCNKSAQNSWVYVDAATPDSKEYCAGYSGANHQIRQPPGFTQHIIKRDKHTSAPRRQVMKIALLDAPQGSVLNALLRGPSFASDVQAVLHARDEYSPDVFLEIAQAMQSNDTSMTDDELEFIVTVARDRSGGARLKLGSVPYEDILLKGRHLYNPCQSSGSVSVKCHMQANL